MAPLGVTQAETNKVTAKEEKKIKLPLNMEISPPLIAGGVVAIAILALVFYLVFSGHGYAQLATRKPMDSYEYTYARATGMKAVGLQNRGLKLLKAVPKEKVDLKFLMELKGKAEDREYDREYKKAQRTNRRLARERG